MRGSDVNTWTLDNFGAGEDLREGVFAQDQNRFKEMLNVRTTSARRIVRRPPVVLSSGSFDSGCRGLVLVGSTLKTIREKGSSATAPAGVSIIEFDKPDNTNSWELIQTAVFNGHVVALIRHAYPYGGGVPYRVFLHVFDGKANKPTYVEDPFCPTSWGPTLPLHVYRSGTAGTYVDYTPKMHVAKGRLYVSRPDGNVAFCKVANARAWNTRTVDEFVDHGEWYYFITITPSGIQEFVVSEEFANLGASDKWACYVLEYLDSTGTWQQFTEKTVTPTVHGEYQPVSVTSRFGGPNEIRLLVYWTTGENRIIRFRLMHKPGVEVGDVSASTDTWGRSRITGGNLLYEGVKFAVDAVDSEDYGTTILYRTNFSQNLTTGQAISSHATGPASAEYTSIVGIDQHQMTRDLTDGSSSANLFYDSGWSQTPGGWNAFTGQYRYRHRAIGKHKNPAVISPGTNQVTARSFSGGETLVTVVNGLVAGDRVVMQPGVLFATCYIAMDTGTTNIRLRDTNGNAGDFTVNIPVNSVAYSWGAGVTTAPFEYGYQAGKETDFYAQRLLDYQLNQAGADDAGYLPTAATAVSGGVVTLLCGIKDRLFVAYKDGAELWEVATDPALASRIDTSPLGTGQQTSPVGVLFEGILMVPLASGLWGVSLGNDLSDRMNSNRLGDPIQRAGIPIIKDAAYWPWLGCYVAAQATNDEFSFRVFDYNRETKVAAWSRWQTAAIGTDEGVDPGHMVAVADRLYFRKGSELLYFDASVYDSGSPVFRDESDAVGNAYVSRLVWHRNDFKRPGAAKRFLYLDMAQRGTCRTAFRTVAYDDNQELDGPTIAGTTYGKERYPLSMTAQAIAPILESTDETGWELERLALDFRYMRR